MRVVAALAVVCGLGGLVVWMTTFDTAARVEAIVSLESEEAGAIDVSWSSSASAEETYRVSASLEPQMSGAMVTKTFEGERGQISGLLGGRRYYVTVQAVDARGVTRVVGSQSVVIRRPAPIDLAVQVKRPGSVSATWRGTDETVDGYVLRYSTDDDFTSPTPVETDKEKATVDGLEPGKTYWFTVEPDDDPRAASEAVSFEVPASSVLEVGSFNVYGVNNDDNRPSGVGTWRSRRPVIVQQIVGADLDVVGLQELNQSSIYRSRLDFGSNQMIDLREALKREHEGWELTNASDYGAGSSLATRIMYRSDRLELVEAGSVRYRSQTGPTARYLAWAVFRVRATGAEVLFANTHLQPGRSGRDVSVKRSQWQQLIGEVTARAGDRPAIVVGDFNTSRNQQPAEMFERMRAAGLSELTGTRAGVNPPTQSRPEERIRGDINSYHGFKRNLRSGSCYCGSESRTGNSIDFIFATDDLEVPRWELVANLDSAYRIVGTMPSDHHLITADITIPVS